MQLVTSTSSTLLQKSSPGRLQYFKEQETKLTSNRKKYEDKTILVVYGGPNEHHEIAIENKKDDVKFSVLQGLEADVQMKKADDDYTIIAWDISDDVDDRKIVRVHSDFYIYMLSKSYEYHNLVIF